MIEPRQRLIDRFADPASNPSGATFRVYSDDVNSGAAAASQQVPLGLWGLGSSPVHHGRDLDFPDTDRANLFLDGHTISNAWSLDKGAPPPTFGQEIAFSPADRQKFSLAAWTEQYQQCRAQGADDATCQRSMPNFIYMALPVDHTLGFNPLSPTPASMVADNDHAVGLIVQRLSESPFWKNTLVFVLEDDTQASGDHVDAHRTFLLTAGGLARQRGLDGKVSHQASSFPSVLRTIEALFRIVPLTIYDRGATPLHDVVVPSLQGANAAHYQAVQPPTPFLRNPDGTTLAALSQRMNWRLDQQNPYLLHDLLYAGIRGWPLPAADQALLSK
jgi:hypothetical protein